MKKQTSSTVITPRSGKPIDADIAAPERYSASKPACFACSAARPLWVPGICRMPGRSSSARKRAPAEPVGRSAATRYGINLLLDTWLSGQPARHPVREHRMAGHELGLVGRMLVGCAAGRQGRLVDFEPHMVVRLEGGDRERLDRLRQLETHR